MRPLPAAIVVFTTLLGGCCRRPSSAWDRPAFAWREASPGVVLVVDRAANMVNCTGTVFRSEPTGAAFRSYVLTARHCVNDDEHPHRWGIAAPGSADVHMTLSAGWLALSGVPVHEATRVLARGGGPAGATFDLRPDAPTVRWLDDWAILSVDTPAALSTLPLFAGDPATAIAPGTPVSLVAYHDGGFRDHYGRYLQAHEHPFAWTGVPPGVGQPGHSGAPIVRDGQVVAMLSGDVANSNACRLLCGSRWETAFYFVSIETVRREAAEQGFSLGPGRVELAAGGVRPAR